MQTSYKREMDFAAALLKRLRMPVHFVKPGEPLAEYDGGLRRLAGIAENAGFEVSLTGTSVPERTVCRAVDAFLCRYICFRLPQTKPPVLVLLGPYLTHDFSSGDLLELAEGLGVSLSILPQFSNIYASMPVYHDSSAVIAAVTTLGEVIWEGKPFDITEANDDLPAEGLAMGPSAALTEQENLLQRMQQMEERYAHENELMEIVAKGLTHKAELMMAGVSALNYQMRAADPLRNQKNYCIICNTLLRKAAQQGGVHPIHLDRISGQFARSIENASVPDQCSKMIGEMVKAYCRLVRSHGGKRYSAPVEKVITYIDANLSGDLSLTVLAGLMNVSPGYLSALFHRETGCTLADHITGARMKNAMNLLRNTRLQVQSVAQLCGYGDPNYFARVFRRTYGLSPLGYRKELRNKAADERM